MSPRPPLCAPPVQLLASFQRQLFRQKPERRLIDDPDQLVLEALLGEAAPPAAVTTQEIHCGAPIPNARDEARLTDEGLRVQN